VIVWFVVQFLHGQLVVPRVMGDNLQIHPLTVLLVLLVMGDLLGLVGVIFGIPIYCLIKVLVIYLFRRFKQRYNRFFGEKGKYEDTEFSKKKYLDK
jgi:predicted PurR-regulated permease PerM